MFSSPTLLIHPLSRFSDFSANLSTKHFAAMVVMAILLHLAGITAYQMMPQEQVMQIPVKALNIKLGGAVGAASVELPSNNAPKPSTNSAAQVALEAALSSLSTPADPAAVKDEQPVKPRRISRSTAAKANTMPSEYVREGTKKEGAGSPLGNNEDGGEEVMRRYEQVLSLWIERHKVYPAAARDAEMEGDAVIRIRINREGKILLYRLEKATKSDVLNDAIEDMVRSANPAPAVPSNYPAGDRFEFLIPVTFRLQ